MIDQTVFDWLQMDTETGWERTQHATAERHSRGGLIAVVGLPGAGKKTLCSSLWGWEKFETSTERISSYGLFTLIDLPLDSQDAAAVLYRLEKAALIIYVLDALEGLQSANFAWITRLRALDSTLMIALNKVDLLDPNALQEIVTQLEQQTARPVIPLSATDRVAVHQHLLPSIIRLCPEVAPQIAAEFSGLRRSVAYRLVLESALTSTTAGVDPDMGISTLINVQTRMIRRIAIIYGGPMRTRIEAVLVLLVRFAMRQAVRLSRDNPHIRPWLISSTIAGLSTLAVGWIAILYYSMRWLPKRSRPFVRRPRGFANGSVGR